jgi:hypothetical protein
MKGLFTALAAVSVLTFSIDDTKLGAGVSLTEATPIKALVDRPADFVGKTVRVDGVATAVCESMGCWMAVAADDAKDAKTVRLKVEDGVIVFPVSAKGKRVSAEGVFEEIAPKDEHGAEAASEHSKQDARASKKYQIKATGAVIR